MKMYKKSELSLVDGLLVSGAGDIVVPDHRITEQANKLETLLQKAQYLRAQPSATPMPSLEGFERKSITDSDGLKFNVSTPMLDFKQAEAMALMDELDQHATASQANAMLADFDYLAVFVKGENVIDCGGNQVVVFDTPTLGSILEMTADDLMDAIAYVCGMERVEDDDDDCLPCGGSVAVPFTKENVEKIEQFFDDLAKDNEPTEE